MGCWNETCMISNLPILAGDEVIVVFLECNAGPKIGGAGICYSTDRCVPITIGINGIYDDYGGADFNDDPLIEEYLKEVFNEYLVEKEVGENRYHEPAVKKEETSWKNLMDWTHEGRLELLPNEYLPDRNVPVSRVMILKEVWDAMVNSKSFTEKIKYYEDMSKVSDYIFNKRGNIEKSDMYLNYPTSEILTKMLYWHSTISPFDVLFKLSDKADQEMMTELGKRIVDMVLAIYFTDMVRIQWITQCGAGSQGEEYECYEELFKVMGGIIEKRVKGE